jgi:endonuclease/exonuclease/phosphatase family metal-dependent hydrolase
MPDRALRVATFNIHHAAGLDGVVDLDRIATVIRTIRPDVLAIQELDERMPRSNLVDQPAELARMLGMHLHFGPAMDLDVGRYGIALASPRGFRAATIALPRLGGEEPRAAVVATWDGMGVVTTHLSRDRKARAGQTQELAKIVEQIEGPIIVIGDLNQPVGDLAPLLSIGLKPVAPHRRFLGRRRPSRQIDHILVSADLEVERSWRVPTRASDHAPLVADITRGT